MHDVLILQGQAAERMKEIPDKTVRCIVTSPPYYRLRSYFMDGQIGQEPTIVEYIKSLVEVFREGRRILTDDGTLWLNLGDTYMSSTLGQAPPDRLGKIYNRCTGENPYGVDQVDMSIQVVNKEKNLCGIPWRTAMALQDDGWNLRSDIIWYKIHPKPESVHDRPTRSHEYLFLLSKNTEYYYDQYAIAEPSVTKLGEYKNKLTVWSVPPETYSHEHSHFAVMPERLVAPCILAGSEPGDTVFDPFCGSGTTGAVALALGRKFIATELNPEYVEMAKHRIAKGVVTNIPRGNPKQSILELDGMVTPKRVYPPMPKHITSNALPFDEIE